MDHEQAVADFSESAVADLIGEVLSELSYMDADDRNEVGGSVGDLAGLIAGATIRSFAEAGLLTDNSGVVVQLPDGAEFQVTVRLSKRPY